jgi:hypothetical protein
VLELDYPLIIGPHIGDVPFTIFGPEDELLPVDRELVFPIAVPLGFVLPPMITMLCIFMSPVPDSDPSALWNHRALATQTPA